MAAVAAAAAAQELLPTPQDAFGAPGRDAATANHSTDRPSAVLALALRDVDVVRRGRLRVLRGRPYGHGTVRWQRAGRGVQRLRGRQLAALWEALQERQAGRARLGGRTLGLRHPRLKGRYFEARIIGSARGLPAAGVLRARVEHHDPRVRAGCPLAPFVRCARRRLAGVDLLRADLRGADLRGADLHGAFLHSAVLAGADLRGADLRGTTLTGADLRGARLEGAHLADANLHGARLSRGRTIGNGHVCATKRGTRDLRNRDCGRRPPSGESLAAPRPARSSATRAAPPLLSLHPRDGAEDVRRTRSNRRRSGVAAARRGPRATRAQATGFLRAREDCTFLYPNDEDTDGDGLSDCFEAGGFSGRENVVQVTPPGNVGGDAVTVVVTSDGRKADTDGDGLDDRRDFEAGGSPTSADTDQDGLSDREEATIYRSALNDADTDRDSLPAGGGTSNRRLHDGAEAKAKTSVRDADTDGDSLSDLDEVTGDPRIADLPQIALVPYEDGRSDVEIGFVYEQTTGTDTESETSAVTGEVRSREASSETSRETTDKLTQEHEVSGECEIKISVEPEGGCKVGYSYTNSQTNAVTRGSTAEVANGQEVSAEYERLRRTSVREETTLKSEGCIEVTLMLKNTGPKSVRIVNPTVNAYYATSEPGQAPTKRSFATLSPVSGKAFSEECEPTEADIDQSIASGDSLPVTFSQRVGRDALVEYVTSPTSITYQMSTIGIKGENPAGRQIDYNLDVADKLDRQTAGLTVDFGDGRVRSVQVAANTTFANDGPNGNVRSRGVALGEALELAGFAPAYTSGPLKAVRSLTDPDSETRDALANADDLRKGAWNLLGNAEGTDNQDRRGWADVVLRPRQQVVLSYARDDDGDGLDDGYERLHGTDPDADDTDADGLDDRVEIREGWTVPLAKGGQPSYEVRSNPINCDADGDGSKDGPGDGNDEYPCPDGPVESARVPATGDGAAEHPDAISARFGTDPNLPDTNGDGLLDGDQPYPDVLRDVPEGGKLPSFARQFGGPGRFTRAHAIAVDRYSPLTGRDGESLPIDIFVTDRGSARIDQVERFTGNALEATPQSTGVFQPPSVGLSSPADERPFRATGLAVGRDTVGSGSNAGPPVAVNYYIDRINPGNFTTGSDKARFPRNMFFTTFNGTTFSDLGNTTRPTSRWTRPFARNYGGQQEEPNRFQAPRATDLVTGSGFLDLFPNGDPVIAHSTGRPWAGDAPGAFRRIPLPVRYNRDSTRTRYGTLSESPSSRGQLSSPAGIAVDPRGEKLYVIDDAVDTITRFDQSTLDADAQVTRSAGMGELSSLTMDPSGEYLYVVARSGYVHKLSPSLSHLGRFGGPSPEGSTGNGTFASARDADVDAAGDVYVTDDETSLVQFFHYYGGPG